MRTAGIICEYNPFHQGHRFQMEEVRRQMGAETGIVCLMSGCYVQRGEPAAYDKWSRAETAVRQGADLVLELPLTVAVNAGGYFAAGAVDCLLELGLVDVLCFGTEGKQTSQVEQTAELLAQPEFEPALRAALAGGVSYARAREQALAALGGDRDCLATPNNALGVDYLCRLRQRDGGMTPMAIARKEGLPTASALRAALRAAESPIHTLEYGERAMLAVLRTLPDEAFRRMPFGSEGLWSKVMGACRRESSLEAILAACKSKRYAYSRLKRMLLCLFLGLSQADLERKPPYLRVLAFNDRGRQLLRRAKKTSALPLVTGAIPDVEAAGTYFALEERAMDLYGLFAPPGVREETGRERFTPPVYVRETGESPEKT